MAESISSFSSANHFDLFGLPVRFSLNRTELDQAYRRVQSQVHPDRFAQASEAQKRVAMQWASRANEAYQTLRSPLRRAAHMCELHGVGVHDQTASQMSPAFLVQQMEWREALEEAADSNNAHQITTLRHRVEQTIALYEQRMGLCLDELRDFHKAAILIREWMFLEKFFNEIETAMDEIHVH